MKTIQDHGNPSLCPSTNTEVEQFYEDQQDPIELTPKKK